MGRIRPFTPDDIPAIVTLRPKAFRLTHHPTAADLGSYIERIFFQNPWRDDSIPSLVHANAAGRAIGFLGVVPRRATFQGASITVAVSTQLMVDPQAGGVAAVQLIKAFFAGRQDLSFADVSGEDSRRLWEALGGRVSQVQSLSWTRPLRPSRFYAAELQNRLGLRGLAFGLRPLCWAIDRASARHGPPDRLIASQLTPEAMAAHLPALVGPEFLRPEYDERSARWLLDQLAAKRTLGDLHSVVLRDETATVVGWYVYYANRGGESQVVQIVARPERYPDVLQHLFNHAWLRGATALSGRFEPPVMTAVGSHGALLRRAGPWVLMNSSRPELLEAFDRGKVFLSRLEGEWWMSF